jgi:hypothetical protein
MCAGGRCGGQVGGIDDGRRRGLTTVSKSGRDALVNNSNRLPLTSGHVSLSRSTSLASL